MLVNIFLSIIFEPDSLGLRNITSGLTGSIHKAKAGNQSVIKFITSICIATKGKGIPNKTLIKIIKTSAKFVDNK